MTITSFLPWVITAGALGVAAAAWSGPAPQASVSQAPISQASLMSGVASVAPRGEPAALPQAPRFDSQDLKQVLREVVREELATQAAKDTLSLEGQGPRGAAPEPEVSQNEQERRVALLDESMDHIDALIDAGTATQEDVIFLRNAVAQLGREEGEQLLSAFHIAVNSGQLDLGARPF